MVVKEKDPEKTVEYKVLYIFEQKINSSKWSYYF